MDAKRKKSCPECGTKLSVEKRDGKTFVVCPKGDFSEEFQDRKKFRNKRPEKNSDGYQ